MSTIDSNPYAAPQASTELAPGAASPGTTGPQPWETGEVIGQSWRLFQAHWATLVGAGIVGYLVILVVQLAVNLLAVGGAAASGALAAVGATVGMVVAIVASSFIQVGWWRVYLAPVRGQAPQFGDLFSGGNRIAPMFGASVLVGIAVIAGMVALIVPGIIVALGLLFAQVLVADTDLGVLDSLKESWRVTSGQKGKLFVLFLAVVGLNIAGTIACLVGLLVTVPMSLLALGIVYTRITGRGAAAA